MSESTKPDLRHYAPELREMLIERRNYWRAKRHQPLEIWDSTNESLVDRDEHIVNEAVGRAMEALGYAAPESAAAQVAAETPPPTVPTPAERPLAELRLDEFRDVAAATFVDFFDRDRSAPSPFFR